MCPECRSGYEAAPRSVGTGLPSVAALVRGSAVPVGHSLQQAPKASSLRKGIGVVAAVSGHPVSVGSVCLPAAAMGAAQAVGYHPDSVAALAVPHPVPLRAVQAMSPAQTHPAPA